MQLLSTTTTNDLTCNQQYTLQLNAIDMHILTAALKLYSEQAYTLTNNVHHTEAADKLYGDMVDAYCTEPPAPAPAPAPKQKLSIADQLAPMLIGHYGDPTKYRATIMPAWPTAEQKAAILVKYSINFKDGSSLHVVATSRQRDAMPKTKWFKQHGLNIGGLGHVVAL